jgi:hypothetical protein
MDLCSRGVAPSQVLDDSEFPGRASAAPRVTSSSQHPTTARTAYERALSVRERRLGRSHELTIQSRQALAAVIAELNQQR